MRWSTLGWFGLQIAIIGGMLWWYYADPAAQNVGPHIPIIVGVCLAFGVTAAITGSIDWYRKATARQVGWWLAGETAFVTVAAFIGFVAPPLPGLTEAITGGVVAIVIGAFVFVMIGPAEMFRSATSRAADRGKPAAVSKDGRRW